ncbi:hypothetical protein [Rhodobacter lacus]|uniref:Uncharacterized protein n=1 Tax=Rhodobacter lacus TaxID=1641972 RepID=A0ABW5A800_9RHOB
MSRRQTTLHGTRPAPRSDESPSGLGWREFFERLGNGTLPAVPKRRDHMARKPVQSFVGYTTVSDSR